LTCPKAGGALRAAMARSGVGL